MSQPLLVHLAEGFASIEQEFELPFDRWDNTVADGASLAVALDEVVHSQQGEVSADRRLSASQDAADFRDVLFAAQECFADAHPGDVAQGFEQLRLYYIWIFYTRHGDIR